MYTKALVVYLDILGLTESIRWSSGNNELAGEIRSVLDVLRLLADVVNTEAERKWQLRLHCLAFSDTLIMSSPDINVRSFKNVAKLVAVIQHDLPRHGYFCRGAIVVGEHYQKDGIIFGPAYIRAYELEQMARWPRVLVDATVLDALKDAELNRTEGMYLLRDDNGLVYLNYIELVHDMKFVYDTKDWPNTNVEVPFDTSTLHEHKARLLACVERATREAHSDRGVLAKYHALAYYHNSVVERLCRVWSLHRGTKGRVWHGGKTRASRRQARGAE